MPDYISPATIVSEIVKTFKVASIYPDGHPERKKFLNRVIERLSAYHRQYPVFEARIEIGSVKVDGRPVEPADGSGEFLARECFLRQIAAVRFLQGVTEADLGQFYLLLEMEPEAVRQAGGAVEVIRKGGSGAVQVDEVDYEGILEKRVEGPLEEDSRYVTRTGTQAAAPGNT